MFAGFLRSVRIAGSQKSAPVSAPVGVKKVTVTPPDGWKPSEGSSMRAASFSIAGPDGTSADVSVIPIPGDSGSVLDNVNRWRSQLQLAPLAAADDPALGKKEGSPAGEIFVSEMTSNEPILNGKKATIASAILKRPGVTWFFKITGDASLVQANLGEFATFVRSWIAWWDVIAGEKKLAIPIPGGTLLGILLIVNLLAAHGARFKLSWNKAGMIVIHSGILLMLLGEIFTGLLGREAQMVVSEGEILNYSTFPREVELVVIRPDGDGVETVTAIPQDRLIDGAEFPFGGFSVKIHSHYPNSGILPESAATAMFDKTRATDGLGKGYAVRRTPCETAHDRRDLTAAFVEVIPDGGKSQGRWLLSNALKGEQSFVAAGRPWKISIRQRRLYHPFSIKLLDFSHDRYLGTNVPKNFSSKIRILNPDTGENREDLIYMNHPLRYGGLTFYQAGFENNDSTSIFQVVRNPVWTLPYISCAMVGCGLLWVFSQHLIKAISRRNQRHPAP